MRSIVRHTRSRLLLLPVALLALGASACSDDSTTEPEAPDPGALLTVDASSDTAWAHVDLGVPAQLVAAGSPAWDLGFQVTKAKVNGAAGVTVYCLCQNREATDAQVILMTPASEVDDFLAVTEAQIPVAGSGWSATGFDEKRWYRYNLTGSDHQVWPTYDVYLVKRGDEVYKVQLTGYYGADGKARQITFRYARLSN